MPSPDPTALKRSPRDELRGNSAFSFVTSFAGLYFFLDLPCALGRLSGLGVALSGLGVAGEEAFWVAFFAGDFFPGGVPVPGGGDIHMHVLGGPFLL